MRLVDLYLFAHGVELWSSPLLGSLSGWLSASSLANLDSYFSILALVVVPPSSMVQRSPKFVQWKKMHPSGSVALALAAYQMVGVFGDGNGWISSLCSGSQAEAEQLRGEEDEDLVVILLLLGSFM